MNAGDPIAKSESPSIINSLELRRNVVVIVVFYTAQNTVFAASSRFLAASESHQTNTRTVSYGSGNVEVPYSHTIQH